MGLPKQLFLLFRIPFPLPEHSYAHICLLKKNVLILQSLSLNFSIAVGGRCGFITKSGRILTTSVWMSILKLIGYFMCAWVVVKWWGGGVWKQKPTISKVPCEVTSKKIPITLLKQQKRIHFKMYFPHVSLKHMTLSRLKIFDWTGDKQKTGISFLFLFLLSVSSANCLMKVKGKQHQRADLFDEK